MADDQIWANGESGLNYVGLLRRQEILSIADRLVRPTPPASSEQFQAASLDLTIGTIITRSHEVSYLKEPNGHLRLPPGGIAIIITREELNLPLNIAGTSLPMMALAREGLLVLSTGHIDPGYSGPLLVRIQNIRLAEFMVSVGQRIITVTLQQLPLKAEAPTIYGSTDYRSLLYRTRQDVLDSATGTLLDVEASRIRDMAVEAANAQLTRVGLLIAGLVGLGAAVATLWPAFMQFLAQMGK